ncbi:MAG: exopolyphosphatase [Rhodospirillales bacterium]|nr:exopolyphosphatase [Rhodospirillales bacterium]
MPVTDLDPARGRIGVIDIGSNSLRLVVYDTAARAPTPLFNEKALCALGRGLGSSGRLNPEGVASAIVNLKRFVAIAYAIGVVRLDVIATAAVRDAADGADFVAEIRRQCGVEVSVLDGPGEGRLSALGVIAGIPDADGVVGDLGGGSVELVPVDRGLVGEGATLPLGPLRLAEFGDSEKRLREVIEDNIASVGWLQRYRGRSFYLVGGSWRALARIHMEQMNYPLHIIQDYSVPRGEAEQFFRMLGRLSRKSLEKISSISKRRLETVPYASLVLSRIVEILSPERLVFSAYGLREGHVYNLLSESERRGDPLIAGCIALARTRPRFGITGEELFTWMSPLFPQEDTRHLRLRMAISLLSDTAWNEHPDYRADEAFLRSLRMPVAGIDHGERVFIATALHARYGGPAEAEIKQATRRLISDLEHVEARRIGIALRFAYSLSGGAVGILEQLRLGLMDDQIVLSVPEGCELWSGETVQRRFDAVGRAFERRAVVQLNGARRIARA